MSPRGGGGGGVGGASRGRFRLVFSGMPLEVLDGVLKIRGSSGVEVVRDLTAVL